MSLYLNQGLTNSIWHLSLWFVGGLPSGWHLCFWVRLKWCRMWKQERKHLCTNANISPLFFQDWVYFSPLTHEGQNQQMSFTQDLLHIRISLCTISSRFIATLWSGYYHLGFIGEKTKTSGLNHAKPHSQ